MSRYSVATIDNPEFINLQPIDINPLMSQCEIKVLYLGQNRNHSCIDENTARDMAKTLRGAPIVGWYKKEKGDFADHGDRVIIDDEGIKFECMTKPYGFVSPTAEVWFQNFEDTDDFGNKVVRKYLMTTGYLWTGQYEEAKLALEEGRPHSMELDEGTLDGSWSTDLKTGIEFFIINDAIFSKLCILGKDVEPCFEGSSVTKPEVSKTFIKVDDDFKNNLYTMMQQLKFALQGGQKMPKTEENGVATEDTIEKNFTAFQDKGNENTTSENQEGTEGEFTKAEDKDENKKSNSSEGGDGGTSEDNDSQNEENDDEDEKKKYSLLEQRYTDLEQKYTDMEAKYTALVEFKNNIDNEKKDALIGRFYMLSDEDKKDVIDNKSKYTFDEIEAKLSIICCRKKVSFAQDTNDNKPATTFSLNSTTTEDNTPDWVKACRETQNRQ